MESYYGRGTVSTDKISDEFIHVNNFGYFKYVNEDLCITRGNGRSDYQILYIDKGYGQFLLDGEFVRAESGSIIILPPGEKNHYEFSKDSNSDYYWIHFAGAGVPELLKTLNLENKLYEVGDFFEFKDIMASMAKAATVEDFTTDSYLSSCIYAPFSTFKKSFYSPKPFAEGFDPYAE